MVRIWTPISKPSKPLPATSSYRLCVREAQPRCRRLQQVSLQLVSPQELHGFLKQPREGLTVRVAGEGLLSVAMQSQVPSVQLHLGNAHNALFQRSVRAAPPRPPQRRNSPHTEHAQTHRASICRFPKKAHLALRGSHNRGASKCRFSCSMPLLIPCTPPKFQLNGENF